MIFNKRYGKYNYDSFSRECALKNKQKTRRGMYDQQVFRAAHNYVTKFENNNKSFAKQFRAKFMREEATDRVIFLLCSFSCKRSPDWKR